ncbi:HAD domain-containing protein [Streptomyces sp. DSM 44915]|uniref:HAD domain-containing protein n=1 Tax=Streptomyces chisholmiae TaxID=3075540 RepID=A0ABU2JMG6_9ACTN|nr:HAD domain-containing protein [Streptomyces sp. DSM 44915]MDT0266107.1 HAD domain-containing protein [Streptomyces sp. DSM 44915]
MTGRAGRPLLFLDVDGPLIPFGAPPGSYPTFHESSGPVAVAGNPLLARLDPAHGPRLAALGCELVWATSWLAEANACVAPLLGLPPLTVVEWPEASEQDERDERDGLHWKTRALVGWAAGRAFVWVDDEITAADRAWVATHHPGPALLHRVAARLGLTSDDYTRISAWLRKRPGAAGWGGAGQHALS